MINSFKGEYAFLSNFYDFPFSYTAYGEKLSNVYPTAEHAFQCQKTVSLDEKEPFYDFEEESP